MAPYLPYTRLGSPLVTHEDRRARRKKSTGLELAVTPNHPSTAPLPNLLQYRESFITQVKRYVSNADERRRFTEILDHFIDWSFKRSAEIDHFDGNYDQHVVSFKHRATGVVFWSAYPRRGDGAKLEILPGGHGSLSVDRLQDALSVIGAISKEPVSDATTLRIPFSALKSELRREYVTALLERMLVDLAMSRERATG